MEKKEKTQDQLKKEALEAKLKAISDIDLAGCNYRSKAEIEADEQAAKNTEKQNFENDSNSNEDDGFDDF